MDGKRLQRARRSQDHARTRGGWPIRSRSHTHEGSARSGPARPGQPATEHAFAAGTGAPMTEREVRAWLDAYGRAWGRRDAVEVASLFTTDASYEITPAPFPTPLRGREAILEYWSAATREDKSVSFGYEVLAVADGKGMVRWQASVHEPGHSMDLEGFFVVSLTGEGRCSELREWWMQARA